MTMDTYSDPKIYSITAREIFDCRGIPTIETTVILNSGYRGIASVPSGISVGTYEAKELRDNDPKRFGGMGVLKAVHIINSEVAPVLRGENVLSQQKIDKKMIDIDGTSDKNRIGSNAILSVSLACCKAASSVNRQPLYSYINSLFTQLYSTQIHGIPTPIFNVINGGKHNAGNLNFQEFQIIPATSKSYYQTLETGITIYQSIKRILIKRGFIHSVGDEGGFAPNLFTNSDAIDILLEAIRANQYIYGIDCFLGLDLAASNLKSEKGYEIRDRPQAYSSRDFIQYLTDLSTKYRFLCLEDPFSEDDWESWIQLTQLVGNEIFIIGDDLLASNYYRLTKAISDKACSAIILKPNQIGTLSELFSVTQLAKKNGIKSIVSHRSGETNDTFIADFAVGIQSEYIKCGAPARGERIAKYNRLLEIEQEISKK